MTPRLRIETITPAQAEEYLATQKRNRRLRPKRVALYAKQMRAGQWALTGEPIGFDVAGQLLQGQHRLRACISAGVPFTTAVIRGLEDNASHVMDTGATRTATNMFELADIDNPKDAAGICRWMVAWEQGSITDTYAMALTTREELLDFYRAHQERIEVARAYGRRIYTSLRSTEVGWNTLAFILLSLPGERGDQAALYLTALADGIDLGEGSPILALRNWIFGRAGRRLAPPEIVAQGIKAFNSWVNGARITHMKGWVRTRHAMPVPDAGGVTGAA